MNIISLLNQIDSREIVLPAIQRDFVWEESKILKLMDSILRGYPVGIILMWETYHEIQFRYFLKEFSGDNNISFYENKDGKKIKIVLDGQQRLQSLYIALYGKYNDKYLFFDVMSGKEKDDFEEDKFNFYFMTNDEAKEWNKKSFEEMKLPEEDRQYDTFYLMKVSELYNMGSNEKLRFRKDLTTKMKLKEEDESRLEVNISRIDEVLTKDINILKCSVIDENKPSKSKDRQTDADILEMFVRINKQGTPLSRSDLIFSMIKLNWKDAASDLPKFVKKINEGNTFEIDIDFVIRCLFAVSDLGTKFNIDLLRNRKNLEAIKSNFSKCCDAIKSTVDIVQKDCWCSSSKILGGYHTLVPFVYYLFHTPKHELPNAEIDNFRKSLYIFGFTSPFSRYADSRLAKFIKDELKPKLEAKDYTFPFKSSVWWVNYWENINNLDEKMIQKNPRLALSLIQGYSGAKIHFQANSSEMDHIFPRSILRQKEFNEAEINHFANFWLLSKGKNQNKSNIHPKKYFSDVSDSEMGRAFIDKEMLNYNFYRRFIKERSQLILDEVTKRLSFADKDFQ
ncbi:MAG: hypothetical protein B6D44_00610 [Ignavibacteriales bacterium UTCHB2]|jgi:uncharacterized protein with ParB-like and HNH nuclease domain|nr:MAG: hypothetical protein B6D44_00610 [Ignavibacteriales bacterium UTCHB2]